MLAAARKRLLQTKSDEELMSLWVESRRGGRGDTAAFELLWERHAAASYQTVLRVLGPRRAPLADEVFQDAWLEVTRAGAYRPGSFRAFLRTVATRKALDCLALSSVRAAGAAPEEEDGSGKAELLAAPASDPQRGTMAREGASVVLRIAERMPDSQRVAWMLRYVEQMTFEEIAEAMDAPVGTAKTRVRLANALLAQGLAELGIEGDDLVADLLKEA